MHRLEPANETHHAGGLNLFRAIASLGDDELATEKMASKVAQRGSYWHRIDL